MKKFLFIYLLIVFAFFLFVGSTAVAQEVRKPEVGSPNVVKLENPMKGDITSTFLIFGKIVSTVMGILGVLTLVAFLVGGFWWLTSAGNAEQVKKGTETMLWAIIGLFIIFGSYAILTLVFNAFTGGTGKGEAGSGTDTPWVQCEELTGWGCSLIDKCGGLDLTGVTSVGEKRTKCDGSKVCATGKCKTGEQAKDLSMVCCKFPNGETVTK